MKYLKPIPEDKKKELLFRSKWFLFGWVSASVLWLLLRYVGV